MTHSPKCGGASSALAEASRSRGASHNALVFGRTETVPFDPGTIRKRANRAWDRAGLVALGLHECRHTYASMMIAAGANLKALSTYLGHSSITIAMDRYGHLMPGNESEAAELFDRYLARGAVMGQLCSASSGVSRLEPLIANRAGWPITRIKSEIRDPRAEGVGFEPTVRQVTDTGFQDRRIQPLCHPSGAQPG